MKPKPIHTNRAPSAIGPYSQAVVHGGLVYCSGQIALDPESGALVGDGAREQTRQVLNNLAAVLDAAGSGLDLVLRSTIYLTTMADFADVNAAYEDAFAGHKPARATVAVRDLPKSARVEIDCIAAVR